MKEKNGANIEEIARLVKPEVSIPKNEVEITRKVLNQLASKMIVKVGDPEKKIKSIEAVGIQLTKEQKEAIRKQFNTTNYPTDALRSINFWGNNAKNMAKLLSHLA